MHRKSNHVFAQVPSIKIPRSVFDTTSTYKTTFNAGKLIPFLVREVLPGDTFNLSVKAFARLTTPIVPFMDNVYMDFQFFYVPTRLVWKNWKKFCGEQANPTDSIDYVCPTWSTGNSGVGVQTIADYMGVPPGVPNLTVNALPFRCVNLIWDNWYRPEDFTNSIFGDNGSNDGDGPDLNNKYNRDPRPRYNRLDYFQGCLPSPQRGAGVQIPLFGSAPLVGSAVPPSAFANVSFTGSPIYPIVENPVTGQHQSMNYLQVHDTANEFRVHSFNPAVPGSGGESVVNGSLRASLPDYTLNGHVDLDNASNMTINALREAFQVQLFKEREQLAGSRYREIILGMFGVRTADASLQIPEYLGGGTMPVQIHAVAQTSSTGSTGTPQGNLAAYGVAGGSPVGFTKSFTEFGYIIGFVSVRADITYQQGLERMYSRKTRFDYYWPVFSHLGEQAVLNKEIYAQGSSVKDSSGNPIDDNVFGYQERYAEYRYGISKVTGKLRSGVAGSLDVWHLAPYYSQLPQLGDSFAQVNVPFSRVLAVTDQPHFVFDSVINCRCVRPMPLYGQPGRIDHYF